MTSVPPEFRRTLDANLAGLETVAARLGGVPKPIDAAVRAAWLAPNAHYEDVRLLETTSEGHRVAVLVNLTRTEAGTLGARPGVRSTPPTWHAHHRIAAFAGTATVPSVLASEETELPLLGVIRMPHFELGARSNATTPRAWGLAPRAPLPKLPRPYVFCGCVDGVLYASAEGDRFDSEATLEAIARLSDAASLPWRAPTAEEVAARTRANKRRARMVLAGCCGVLALIGGLVLLGWQVLSHR